jgi:hypothetical protein
MHRLICSILLQFILDDAVLERINRLDLFVDNWRSQLAQQAAAAKEAKAAQEAAAASGGHEHHRQGYHSSESRAQRARQRHVQHATAAAGGQVRVDAQHTAAAQHRVSLHSAVQSQYGKSYLVCTAMF